MTDSVSKSPQNGLVRVVDDKGHLIFKYNPHTQCIEIKMPVGRSSDNGKVFLIDTTVLRSAGFHNAISDDPIWEFRAKVKEGDISLTGE
jgi:hypothetical protein